MFFPEGQIRIRLYGAPCDMRKYELPSNMRNAWPACICICWNFSALSARYPPLTQHNVSLQWRREVRRQTESGHVKGKVSFGNALRRF